MDEILQRLKARKLVQWALAYVAAAFALIQVLDVVAQRFGWPESLERILILVFAFGFFTYALVWSPLGKPMRALPEFSAFLREKGFIALWDKYGPPDLCSKNATGDYVCS